MKREDVKTALKEAAVDVNITGLHKLPFVFYSDVVDFAVQQISEAVRDREQEIASLAERLAEVEMELGAVKKMAVENSGELKSEKAKVKELFSKLCEFSARHSALSDDVKNFVDEEACKFVGEKLKL